MPDMKTVGALVTEFIGTMFLVFTIQNAVSTGSPLAPIGIGCILMVMVFAGGFMSGAHYNPAVTFAIFWAKQIDAPTSGMYWAVQLAGGLTGAALGALTCGKPGNQLAVPSEGNHPVISACIAEFMLTFALTFVVLHAAVAKPNANNSFFGLAIGFTVLSGAISVGGISGGVFNPAVGLGLGIVGVIADSDANGSKIVTIIYYCIAQLLAAFCSGMYFRFMQTALGNLEDEEEESLINK